MIIEYFKFYMRPKNAIIILIIITILSGLFMVYLYQVMRPPESVKINPPARTPEKVIKNIEPEEIGEIKEEQELTPAELKQRMIEKSETPASRARKEELDKMTPEEREAIKREMIERSTSVK